MPLPLARHVHSLLLCNLNAHESQTGWVFRIARASALVYLRSAIGRRSSIQCNQQIIIRWNLRQVFIVSFLCVSLEALMAINKHRNILEKCPKWIKMCNKIVNNVAHHACTRRASIFISTKCLNCFFCCSFVRCFVQFIFLLFAKWAYNFKPHGNGVTMYFHAVNEKTKIVFDSRVWIWKKRSSAIEMCWWTFHFWCGWWIIWMLIW